MRFFAVNFLRAKIDQHEMIVGAAGNDAITVVRQTGCECLGIDHNLALIIAERRLQRFMKTNRFRRDNMHERSALDSGKNSRVDLFRKFLLAQDNPAARAA